MIAAFLLKHCMAHLLVKDYCYSVELLALR